ncbi:hypothetical protein QQF64_032141 [Cirrhinus molitorella]|uniref:MHC class I antigen n=1 Tax=Cirrhinus molitorella TaxID=172907 RepID=A0ABR3MYY3_9TELE
MLERSRSLLFAPYGFLFLSESVQDSYRDGSHAGLGDSVVMKTWCQQQRNLYANHVTRIHLSWHRFRAQMPIESGWLQGEYLILLCQSSPQTVL